MLTSGKQPVASNVCLRQSGSEIRSCGYADASGRFLIPSSGPLHSAGALSDGRHGRRDADRSGSKPATCCRRRSSATGRCRRADRYAAIELDCDHRTGRAAPIRRSARAKPKPRDLTSRSARARRCAIPHGAALQESGEMNDAMASDAENRKPPRPRRGQGNPQRRLAARECGRSARDHGSERRRQVDARLCARRPRRLRSHRRLDRVRRQEPARSRTRRARGRGHVPRVPVSGRDSRASTTPISCARR